MKKLTSIVIGSVVSFAALGGAVAESEAYGPPAPSKAFEFVNGKWQRRADACGTHQVRKAPVELVTPGGAGPITVYLNRNGGTYSPAAATNSSTNTVDSSTFTGGSFTIPAMTGYNWTTLRACILEHYEPYDVTFTDTQPASGNFIEAVIGGNGTEVELQGSTIPGLLGVAAADNFCGVTQRGIAFSFSAAHNGIPQALNELCATVAHEIGHLLALEHEVLATDTMSYVFFETAGSKSFHDQNSACGTEPGAETDCSCSSGSTTNSGARLEEFVGLSGGGPGPNDPPVMSITSPTNGATVAPGFTVVATADEPLDRVELRIDGDLVATDTSSPFQLQAPDDIAAGDHTLQVRGYDPEGASGNRSIMVTVEGTEPPPECEIDDDCDDGEECVDDECVPEGETPGELGDDCERDEDCASNMCLVEGDEQHCAEPCAIDGDDCPSGFECLPYDDAGACWPADDGEGGGGGGCAATGGAGAAPILLGVGLAALLRRRRKR
jgi:uncharacterized protein (TIGR03382 family)